MERQFPVTATTGETRDRHVSEISHLKYIPTETRKLTTGERQARRKLGQLTAGYEMHLSAYYQGLAYNKKGKSHMIDKLNQMWVRACFEAPFVNLVKQIGTEETNSKVLLKNRRWIPVPIGEVITSVIHPDLLVNVKVPYQQGQVHSCVFRSLASAFHFVGQKHTGSVLASLSKQNTNLPGDEQIKLAIAVIKKHDTVYKKMDYWKKPKTLASHDFIGQPNDNPKLFVLRGRDGGVQHAVSVVGSTIFDSNQTMGLSLCKESLDWCCSCPGGFDRMHTVVQFRK